MGYNTITLGGNQVCDYLYVTTSGDENSRFRLINEEPGSWEPETLMLAQFNTQDMSAGNSSLTSNIEGYEIRRKSGDNLHTEYVGKVDKSEGGSDPKRFIVDYMVKNNT